MCVVAHPDDECFGFGGALALAADHGIDTYVVCLTDGQAATNRGDATSDDDLGRMRRAEFKASCEVLGVSQHELMEYRDGHLEFVDFSTVAKRIAEKIQRFQPDVVITFGGDGGLNTHPDHMMVSMLTTAAFHWAGQAKRYPDAENLHRAKRLYYLSSSFALPDRPPVMLAPWTVTLDIRSVQERKHEAFRRHVSQAPLMEQNIEVLTRHGAEEFYALAAAPDPQPAHHGTDLFEGLA